MFLKEINIVETTFNVKGFEHNVLSKENIEYLRDY
jgi:hypothetical protein